jgi:hypothetical protein
MVIAGVCTICEAYPLVLDDNKNTHLAEKCTQREMYLKQEKEFLTSFEHAIVASWYFPVHVGKISSSLLHVLIGGTKSYMHRSHKVCGFGH